MGSNTFGTTWATVFFDYNNDGWLDLYLVSGDIHGTTPDTPNLFLENTNGVFNNIAPTVGLDDPGRARSASIADFDQDGFVDVFVGNYGTAPLLYQNTTLGRTDISAIML